MQSRYWECIFQKESQGFEWKPAIFTFDGDEAYMARSMSVCPRSDLVKWSDPKWKQNFSLKWASYYNKLLRVQVLASIILLHDSGLYESEFAYKHKCESWKISE